MSLAYRFGCIAIQAALNISPLASSLSAFSRVWSRHSRIYRHLKTAKYDGVIDGGANIGEFASLVRAALPDADLICVEPHPGCAASLRAAGYHVIEAALWTSVGKITLSQPTKATTSCSVMNSCGDAVNSWEVATIRLEDISVQGRKILLKLDLQGAEIEAFKGIHRLWNRIDAVLSEVSIGPSGNYEEIRAFLSEKGFCETSTFNELEKDGLVVEADKLWARTASGLA